jgi:hypothetical protein
VSTHDAVARAWKAMSEYRRLSVEELEAEVREAQAERDEARGVARVLAGYLRIGKARDVRHADQVARQHPWLVRGEGLE